jgi:hypothetical protein
VTAHGLVGLDASLLSLLSFGREVICNVLAFVEVDLVWRAAIEGGMWNLAVVGFDVESHMPADGGHAV